MSLVPEVRNCQLCSRVKSIRFTSSVNPEFECILRYNHPTVTLRQRLHRNAHILQDVGVLSCQIPSETPPVDIQTDESNSGHLVSRGLSPAQSLPLSASASVGKLGAWMRECCILCCPTGSYQLRSYISRWLCVRIFHLLKEACNFARCW